MPICARNCYHIPVPKHVLFNAEIWQRKNLGPYCMTYAPETGKSFLVSNYATISWVCVTNLRLYTSLNVSTSPEKNHYQLTASTFKRQCQYVPAINQSINAEFVGRRYTTRPGAPAESVKSTIKKYILESFSICTGISNIMKVRWKSVAGGCSCSWQNVRLWASGPQSVSAAGCRNRGNTVCKVFWC